MEPSSRVTVSVQNLSGGEVEVIIGSDANVHDLKVEVFQVWPSMPVSFQILSACDTVLEDHVGIGSLDLSSGCGSLSVTAILSIEAVAHAISLLNCDLSGEKTFEVLASLEMLGPKKYHGDIVTPVGRLLRRLETDDTDDTEVRTVRLAALTCISKIAEKGDMNAIELVTAQFEHESSRQAAVLALEQIADMGDHSAMIGVARFLDPEDPQLCMFALEVMEKFARKGRQGVIKAVGQCLRNEVQEIRWKAKEILLLLLANCDELELSHANEMLQQMLRYPDDRYTRWAVEEVLRQLRQLSDS